MAHVGNRLTKTNEEDLLNDLVQIDTWMQDLLRTIPKLLEAIDIGDIEEKSNARDLVTAVDKGLEDYLTKAILERFPDHNILGEETFIADKVYDQTDLWVIDPIDGTTNFVKQGDQFCTLVAYFHDGEPLLSYIYEIRQDKLYHAMAGKGVSIDGELLEKPTNLHLHEVISSVDVRRMYINYEDLFSRLIHGSFATRAVGTCGLDTARVIDGRFGIYLNYLSGPWDYAPLFLMAKEMDLVFLKLDWTPMTLDHMGGFVLSTPQAYDDLLHGELQ